jgi:hypothetical protein
MLTFRPWRANPDYRKEVVFVNKTNPANTDSVLVRANIIDRHRITFHSHFYQLTTPLLYNEITFSTVVVNCPKVRSWCLLRNFSVFLVSMVTELL